MIITSVHGYTVVDRTYLGYVMYLQNWKIDSIDIFLNCVAHNCGNYSKLIFKFYFAWQQLDATKNGAYLRKMSQKKR